MRSSPSRCRMSNHTAPRAPTAGWVDRLKSLIESWNALGRPSSDTPSASPSRMTSDTSQIEQRGTTSGHAVGDVVEVPGEEPHVVAVAMGLDPGAVELPLHRAGVHRPPSGAPDSASPTSAAVDASIGCTATPTRRPTASSASSPSTSAILAVAGRSPLSIAARRTVVAGTPAPFATRVEHETGQGPLAELADQQPAEEVGLVGRGPGRQGRRASPAVEPASRVRSSLRAR